MKQFTIIGTTPNTQVAFDDFSFVRDLNLRTMFDFRAGANIDEPELNIEDFFTVDRDTILLRQEMFFEFLNCPDLYNRLCQSFIHLRTLFDLQKEKDASISHEKLLYSIREMEDYVAYMDDIRDIFSEYSVKSLLLQRFWQILEPLCTGDSFDQLRKEVQQQLLSVKNIRSISVGINLDSQLRPFEAGVLDIHDDYFVSGELIDRILRMDLKKDTYTCKAPLYPIIKKATPNEMNAIKLSVNSVLNKVFASALQSWSRVVKNYVINSLRELTPVLSEWRFVSACTDVLQKLKQKDLPLCHATFGKKDCIKGMYHPILALSAPDAQKPNIVKNNLSFDTDKGIYILTGPNQGGKSIYTQATGILYAMLHLGLPLPADDAVVKPIDEILTHFIDIGAHSYQHGRLSAECDRIYAINSVITDNSLFLFDEALSSTNAIEAVAISSEILKAYSEIGARGIWTTHYHELCKLKDEFPQGKSRICNLTAQIDESTHVRQFIIVPGSSASQSYANDIAQKYHLSKSEIVSGKIQKKVSPE